MEVPFNVLYSVKSFATSTAIIIFLAVEGPSACLSVGWLVDWFVNCWVGGQLVHWLAG